MAKRKKLHEKDDEVNLKRIRSEQNANDHENLHGIESLYATNSHGRPDSSSDLRQQRGAQCCNQPTDGLAGRREGPGKVTRLLDALDDLLQSETEEKYFDVGLDEDILLKCRKLRKCLDKQRIIGAQKSTTNTPNSMAKTSDDVHSNKKLPNILSPRFLTPWTSSSITPGLPPLPGISDPALEAATFTHSAMVTRTNPTSYERLEWVGDAYVELISTLLISSTFTALPPGKSAQLRELIVKNETLASYARQYDFQSKARLPPEFSPNYSGGAIRPKDKEVVKVFGDMFEAYVAAVVMSDPQHGVDRVASWLKGLWAKTLSKQINDQARENRSENSSINSKVLLTQKIGAKGVNITYKDAGPETKDPVTGFKLFSVGVYLTGWGEHDKELGVGRALSKKDAGTKAAEAALKNNKLIRVYEDKKKAFDERMRAEKEGAAINAGCGVPKEGK